MSIRELYRHHNKSGETVVEYEAGDLRVRLTDSYDSGRTFGDLVFVIASRRLAEQIGMREFCAS